MRDLARILVATGAMIAATSSAWAQVFLPGSYQLTQYWIATEHERAGDHAAVPVFHRDGHPLTWVCGRFASSLTMEGTGRTWDGRLFNWDGRSNGRSCFVEMDTALYPFGAGVQGYALVPWRSLAVDARFVPIGHTVELHALAGFPLPDGSRHDGCFVAVDGGGAIRGHHLDMFVPAQSDYARLSHEGWLPDHVEVVMDPPRCEHARRFAVLPLPTDPRTHP